MPDIDLFASRLNNRVETYYSWKPDPFAIGVDAFQAFWGESLLYIFPPFSLMGKVLPKLEHDQGTAIVIAPYWPTQSWFSKLLKMLIDCPFFFDRTLATISHPTKAVMELPRMKLLACCLSGNRCKPRTYQAELKPSYCRHGDL